MSPVRKETAENFYGTGERDHQLMLRIRWSKRIWCACRRISPAGAEEAWRRGVCGENTGGESRPSKKALCRKRQRAFLLGGAGGIRTHGPRKANGFRVRLVMTTSILLHDEMISGDG